MEECRPIEPLGTFGRFKQRLPFKIRIVKIKDEERKKLKKQEKITIIVFIITALTSSLLAAFVHPIFLLIASFIPIWAAYSDNKEESRKKVDNLVEEGKPC